MEPKILRDVVSDPNALFVLNGLNKRPALALLLAEIIGLWSEADVLFGELLAQILKVNVLPAIEIYQTLRDWHLRSDVLAVAAKSVLDEADFELFAAILSMGRSFAEIRNKLVHRPWAITESIPNGLLLVDPKSRIKWEANLIAQMYKASDKEFSFDFYDTTHVYMEEDFRDILGRMWKLCNYLRLMNQWASSENSERAELFRRLSSELDIQEVLSRLRQRHKSNPKAQKR